MTVRKLLPLSLVLLAATSALAVAAALATNPPQPPPNPPKVPARAVAPAPARADPKPQPKGPNKLLVYRAGSLVLIGPDGKNEEKVTKADDYVALPPHQASLSPDGKRVLVLAPAELPEGDGVAEAKVWVRELGKDGRGTELCDGKIACWSGDGTEVVVTDFTDGPPGTDPKATHHVVAVATKARTAVKLPAGHLVTDWSRDGKYFLTTQPLPGGDKGAEEQFARLWVMNRDGTEHKALTGGKRFDVLGKFSPDGKRVLHMEVEAADGKRREYRKLSVIDVATGKATPVEEIPLNAELSGYCWSPDGKRIAYTWRQVTPADQPAADAEAESFLVVCDPDGKNARTLLTEKGKNRDAIGGVDWR